MSAFTGSGSLHATMSPVLVTGAGRPYMFSDLRTMLSAPSVRDICATMPTDLISDLIPLTAAGERDSPDERDGQGATVLEARPKLKKPPLYKVLMLNDDYTPMEFVVDVLNRFFGMDEAKATSVMLQVHQQGVGLCGVFTYEIAETKVTQVIDFARRHEHPLQCTLERE